MTDPNQYNPQVPQPAAQYGTPDYGQAQAPQYLSLIHISEPTRRS